MGEGDYAIVDSLTNEVAYKKLEVGAVYQA